MDETLANSAIDETNALVMPSAENAASGLSLDEVVARAKLTVAGTAASENATVVSPSKVNSANTTSAMAPALASFKFSGPAVALKPATVGDAASAKTSEEAAEAMDVESSLNQSALKMINLDYNIDYNSDDDVLSIIEEEMRSNGATDESDLEDGEVEEADKSLSSTPSSTSPSPKPSSHSSRAKVELKTSTPVDLDKKSGGVARKRLNLSPSKVTDKVCTDPNNLDPALAPALVPAASGGVERPKRTRTINKFFSENYVLDMKIVPKPAVAKEQSKFKPRRPRPSSVASNRPEFGSEPTKIPSILQFLKPIGASKKGSKGNETLRKSKVTAAEPRSEATVTQTLMSNYYFKN